LKKMIQVSVSYLEENLSAEFILQDHIKFDN